MSYREDEQNWFANLERAEADLARRKCSMGDYGPVVDGRRTMVPCTRQATRYGFYRGANSWAGPVCDVHASAYDWTEPLGGNK